MSFIYQNNNKQGQISRQKKEIRIQITIKLERSRLCISSLPQLMQSDQFSWFVDPRTND